MPEVLLYAYGDVIALELFVSWNRRNVNSTLFKKPHPYLEAIVRISSCFKVENVGKSRFLSSCKVGFILIFTFIYLFILYILPPDWTDILTPCSSRR